jgi:hypothetical protein
MTDDDILRMAREAGGTWEYRRTFPVACVMYDEELIRFAALVAAAEREKCAKVCDEIANKPSNVVLGVALDCAAAIRARGEK